MGFMVAFLGSLSAVFHEILEFFLRTLVKRNRKEEKSFIAVQENIISERRESYSSAFFSIGSIPLGALHCWPTTTPTFFSFLLSLLELLQVL